MSNHTIHKSIGDGKYITFNGFTQAEAEALVVKVNEYDRLRAIEKLAGELVKPLRQPAKIGGGVVMKCKQCNGSWWLDEPDEIHLDPTCAAVQMRALLEVE